MPAFAASALQLPATEVALAGVSTPLSHLQVSGLAAAEVAVIISAVSGLLYADPTPGAVVSGGGSSSLWIAGSVAQVNAKLASLVYRGDSAGVDTLKVRLVDAAGQGPAPQTLPVSIVPLEAAGNAAVAIDGGTLTLNTKQVDGLTLEIHDSDLQTGAASLVLVNSTLGASTRVDLTGASDRLPRLAFAGSVSSAGSITVHDSGALITIARNASITNGGIIQFADSTASISGDGTLLNNGMIAVSGSSAASISVAVGGAGEISIGSGAGLTLGAVAAGETIRFDGSDGVLTLSDPSHMMGTIAGFTAGDRIELGGLHYDASAVGSDNTLTFYNGAVTVAQLHFAEPHRLSDFLTSVATDQGEGGAAITSLTLLSNVAAEGSGTANGDVYRFFDTTHGTQLLTADAEERDSILAARPDLAFEGTAMHTASSADPDAVAVYRFFDTATGTHFMTASVSERDSLIATRPDLAYEPGSTLWEHGSQQAGDVPVYRFFDTTDGTHFYTASAAERAGILATRPDMQAEGIAFYTPGS